MTLSPHRITLRERAKRILDRIFNAGEKGLSVKQIARPERISTSRINYYLRTEQKKRGGKIRRLGKKFYYVNPNEVEVSKSKRLGKGDVELRGYFNYTSSDNPSSDISIDCVIVVPNENHAIITGSERITQKVKHRLGAVLASKLQFGVSEADPFSENHFRFSRRGEEWIEFD